MKRQSILILAVVVILWPVSMAKANLFSFDFTGNLSVDFGTLSSGTELYGRIAYEISPGTWKNAYSINTFSIFDVPSRVFSSSGGQLLIHTMSLIVSVSVYMMTKVV